MQEILFSVVIPVYNRPDEVRELLTSLQQQHSRDFEVLVVEDGSGNRCETVVDAYRDALNIQYFFKPNSGPGPSRNFGFDQAKGLYFVVFDSDCILPPHYFDAVKAAIAKDKWDAWGGPDRAHERFTPVQQAMGYTMSSVLTTGGIRGGKDVIGKFQPRSFNMGLSREVYKRTGGFAFARFAEDIELSIRMHQAGFKVGLIRDAYVYHKRRASFAQFFRQVFHFGRGRVMVGRAHPEAVKMTHWFPTFFMMGMLTMPLLPMVSTQLFFTALTGFLLYMTAIAVFAYRTTRLISVAMLAIPSALLQLVGYGLGFLTEKLKIIH
jgi:glycosyltransferase involved in cell wall biosynthesis